MTYFFWVNTNSIHQSSFFNALASKDGIKVVVVVTESLSTQRTEMGWSEPTLKGVELIYLRQFNEFPYFLISENKDRNNVHIFWGISAFPNVHKAFMLAVKFKLRIGIFTEPLDIRGLKGKMRMLRGFLHRILYDSYIEFIIPTGQIGVAQFILWGYAKSKVFEWAYTVSKSSTVLSSPTGGERPFKIMFAGSLIHRKGCDILLKAVEILKDENFILDLYCLNEKLSSEGSMLIARYSESKKINFLKFLENSKLRCKMNEYDLFILPSRHDGWGAVVSESLMEGTPALASIKCGSSTLINHDYLGRKIDPRKELEIAKIIKEFLREGTLSYQQRLHNRKWAESKTSGEAMSNYFLEIIEYTSSESSSRRPVQPWLNN